MPQYQLTEKGIQEARKRRTVVKGFGEAITFGGPWKGEDYANILLVSLLAKPRQARDVHEITVEAFNKPRPSEAKVNTTLSYLKGRGFVKMVEPRLSHTGFSDNKGQRFSRKSRRGWKRAQF